MATAPAPSSLPRDSRSTGMSVSRYDQVSGMLVAVLIILGFITLMMFLIWLSTRVFWVEPPVPVTLLDVGGGGSGQVAGGEREFEEPNPEEINEVVEQPIEQTIESITAVVTTQAQQLDAVEGSTSLGSGQGEGTGDGRGKGPGGPGTEDGIPAYERWEVRMSAASLDEYARQLEYFGVELAVAGGGNPNVEYITKLTAPKPSVRRGDPKAEKRLRFLHKSGELRQADRQLAARAGVATDGRVVFQFYSDQMYKQLLQLEYDRKGKRTISQVRKTVFGVRGSAGRYEFYVIEQHYMGA
jgi:hypothetical protein